MKIWLSVGHSMLVDGEITSADGTALGGVNEYMYNKNLVEYVARYLKSAGHTVDVIIIPEKTMPVKNSTIAEMNYKIPKENAGNYDLSIELHLNAFNGQAHGTEVYYKTEKGKPYAERVVKNLSQYFTNRGAIKRDNLYMLNRTKAPAILIESFFCDSKTDYNKAQKIGLIKIGKAIAEGICGKELNNDMSIKEDTKNTVYKVQVGAFSNKKNAIKLCNELKEKGYKNAFVK